MAVGVVGMVLSRRRILHGALASAIGLAGGGRLAIAAPAPGRVLPAPGGHYSPNADPLAPMAFLRLPPGAVTARGWLAGQLRRQLDGLCGHYPEISHFLDMNTSGWIHPANQGWEEVTYWLRGYVDLAIVTGDPAALDTSRRWLDGILATEQPDGFFGPTELRTSHDGGPDFWPYLPLLQAFRSWVEHTGDERVLGLLSRFLRYMSTQDPSAFATSWISYRTGDVLDVIFWQYNRTTEAYLLDLADAIHAHAADWTGALPNRHNVNIAQGFREPAQYALRTGDAALTKATYDCYAGVLAGSGQFPGGGFAGDENIRPGFGDPRQGFETCGIVEFMASHQLLTRITGDPVWADRCEDLAFNLLPASLDPDGKAVHYVTSANVVDLDNEQKTQGQFQNGFAMQAFHPGVDRYRCCPHNYGMGWPYFTEELWLATPDLGLAAAMYAPSAVTATVADGVAVTITEDTEYPFADTVSLTLSLTGSAAFPLYLRIPAWCAAPALTVNGTAVPAPAGPAFAKIDRSWTGGDVVALRLPQRTTLRTWRGNHDAVSVDRGPLTYSLLIGEEYVRYAGSDQFPEYAVHATTPWNYGLVPDPELTFTATPGPLPDNPFTHDGNPLTITAPARRVEQWTADPQHVVTPLQPSPARSEAAVEPVTLIPMGAARLRITTFPTADPAGRPWTKGTTVFRIRNRNSGKVLAVDQMSTDDGAQVVQFDDSGTADHAWQLVDNGDGWYRIVNRHSGKALGPREASTADSAPVVQFPDGDAAHLRWQLIDNGDGWYRLANRHSGKVLGVADMSTDNSAHVVQFGDNGTADHLWLLIPDQPVRVANQHAAKLLGVAGESTEDSAQVVQFADVGRGDQRWTFVADANGWFTVHNANSGKVLAVDQMSTSDDASVVQFADSGTADHQWRLLHDGAGWFRLGNRNSGKVLAVLDGSTADDAPAVQFTDNGDTDHRWRLF